MFGWIVVVLGRTIKSPGKQQISEQQISEQKKA